MRIIALDVGDKRIGAAVSDPLGITAQGVGVVNRRDADYDVDEIKKIVDGYKAQLIVVGMPLNMDGTKGESAKKAALFAEALRSALNIPVETYDERLSTKESQRFLISADVSRKRRKEVIDTMAAQLILQSYLSRMAHEKPRE